VRRPGIVLTALIAWIGVVLGHLAAYLLTYPNQGLRHIHLAVTGHSWLGLATASALAAIPVVVLVAAIRSVRSDAPWVGGALALRLAAIQIPAFALLEVLERQWSIGQALSDPAVFVGLVLQPLFAVLAAWILGLVRRVARAIALRIFRTRLVPRRSLPRLTWERSAPRHWLLLSARRRAPPIPRFI
jgi:hypothetical protein